MSTTTTTTAPAPTSGLRIAAWVIVGAVTGLGITYGLAAMHDAAITTGTTTLTPATCVGVAALCYMAAAATQTRWVVWAGIPVFSGVAFAGLLGAVPWWVLLVLAGAVLLVVGLAVGARRATTVQALAMLAYFGVAVVSLFLAPRLGLALAGSALAAHAAWDVVHYRRDAVVDRRFTIFCIGLDLTVGLFCVVLAVAG